MRPRVFPAEDDVLIRSDKQETVGFNEAAGIPRGRPECLDIEVKGEPASMRPRVFPAEDSGDAAISVGRGNGFNEAAGIPRGRRGAERWMVAIRCGLQ